MQRGKIVCRNTVESFVNKQDWTLNGKIFEFTFEWFERFSELYNIYPVKGAPIRNGFEFFVHSIYDIALIGYIGMDHILLRYFLR